MLFRSCKIAPGVLSEILKNSCGFPVPKELMVGIETSDDAAVYKLNDEQALIATTDFFMPIVDDPFDFGRIAATNAISDVYAMGGTPIMALALVGMPIAKLPPEVIGQVLAGGAEVCREAGIPAHEKNFSLTEVYSAEEAFVTGTFASCAGIVTLPNSNPPGASGVGIR